MNFLSDNSCGVVPQVQAAFAASASGFDLPYGKDSVSGGLDALLSDHFGCDAAVVLTSTGTAANALALATLCAPYEAILCHPEAHINLRESGAPEFFTQGAKLVPLTGPDGRIDPDALETELARSKSGRGQSLRYAVVSVTQPTDFGTLYSEAELRRICEITHAHGAMVHMDGARFPAAVVATGLSPARSSWEAGVDVLTFGGTKSGGFAAEAVVFFNAPETLRARALLLQKRSGQTLSKMRFLSCQWPALIEGGVVYEAAGEAITHAARLERVFLADQRIAIAHPREINMVFAKIPVVLAERLRSSGVCFLTMLQRADEVVARFVTSFETTDREIEDLARLLAQPN
jgi:threonine aldolase